jgi:hypothetical protein
VEPHSFDAPRERRALTTLRGFSLTGVARTIEVTTPTLVAAIKPNCDGCTEFVRGDLKELDHVTVILVSATNGNGEWDDAPREILVAPQVLDGLGIRSAPYYVLVNPSRSTVVTEGALMSPAQVAQEIERHLAL